MICCARTMPRDSVITDVMGLSRRRMIEAIVAGESDPMRLAARVPDFLNGDGEFESSFAPSPSTCACAESRPGPIRNRTLRSPHVRRKKSHGQPLNSGVTLL
jgi:hypothetical protein